MMLSSLTAVVSPAVLSRTLAALDIAILRVEEARDIILPLRIPVATECCYLTSTLDGLRRHRRAVYEAFEQTAKKGE